MKKVSAVLVAVVIALSAAGCAAQGDAAPQAANASGTAAPTSAPITMAPEEPAPTETASPYGEYTQDQFFVKAVAAVWTGGLPSDSTLVAAGKDVCSRIATGESATGMVAIDDGGTPRNNEQLVFNAQFVYCPDTLN